MTKYPLILLTMLLIACQPDPEPTPPQPTADALFSPGNYYFPYLSAGSQRPKLGLAAGGIYEFPTTPQLLNLDWGAPSHAWSPNPQTPGQFFGLLRYPMLWGVTAQERINMKTILTAKEYQGVVLPFNECDRPDQCGKEICVFMPGPDDWDCSDVPAVTATAMIAAMDSYPAAYWITPSFSDADKTCQILAAWWLEFRTAGGDESRIVGMGYHRYTTGNDDFSAVLDECYENLKAANVPTLPVWVTEAGLWWDCGPVGADRFKVRLEGAMEDERVVNVMIYAPRASYPFCPLMDADGLTEYGQAVRTGGVVLAYP